MPAGSKMDPPLAKAKPISASVITYLRRKTKELRKTFAARERSEKMIKCTLMKSADDTKLSGEVDTSEGRATLQEDLGRLEEWANKNLMKFNKDKCKVLHLRKYHPGVQHRLGSTWLESSSVERNLGVLVDNKLNTNKQCAAGAKQANRMLGCTNKDITSRDKVIIPLSACQATSGILCSVLVPAVQKRCGQAGEGPEMGHEDDQRTGKPAI
ncbi:hypothetical protein GRJ2_000636200 [Grus japonensis]|uniref:Rna-directed dna polymerase from mobile element jockey-like n=1 Tax=Grus japonensis TaxID=30415 RepID=A0ABC9W820_GRUJA